MVGVTYVVQRSDAGRWVLRPNPSAVAVGIIEAAEPGPLGPRYRARVWAFREDQRHEVGHYNSVEQSARALMLHLDAPADAELAPVPEP